jgi:hypothetical protein
MDLNPYESPPIVGYASSGQGREESGFGVDCECGAVIPVNASQAGATVTCRCGRFVAVARLSQLRTRAGFAAHETNIRDSILRMIDDQLLPWGQCCAVTEMPTTDVMWFDIQCESTFSKGGPVHPLLAIWSLLIPGGVWAMLLRSREPAEIHGRDIVIRVPLLVQQDKQAGFRKSTQRRLKTILSKVPVYQELLREHPSARILVG